MSGFFLFCFVFHILTSFLGENNLCSGVSLAHHLCDWANLNIVRCVGLWKISIDTDCKTLS